MSLKETVVKIHMRWYLTPDKMHRFYPNVSETCFRGCPATSTGTSFHTFWSWPSLKPIWIQAATKVAQMTGSLITLTLPMCLLFAPLPDVPAPTQKIAHTLFCATLWGIALNWHSSLVPRSQVLQRMEAITRMERIHHTIFDTMHIYDCKWAYWSSYGGSMGSWYQPYAIVPGDVL